MIRILVPSLAITLFATFSVTAEAGRVQSISFAQLKAACTDPDRFHNQIAPKNIKVSCSDVQTKWVSTTPGTLKLPTSRQVTSAVTSDKYSVNPNTVHVTTSPQTVSCPKYKKISESIALTKSITCGDITQFPGSGTDYCVGLINALRAKNPAGIQRKDTGEEIDLCTASSTGRGQRGQRGQRGGPKSYNDFDDTIELEPSAHYEYEY